MAGKPPTAGTAMCDFPSVRLFPMVSGKTSYPIHPTGRTGFRQYGTFTAGELPSGIPSHPCRPSTRPVFSVRTAGARHRHTADDRRDGPPVAGLPAGRYGQRFPDSRPIAPNAPRKEEGGYRMLQLRIICSAVLFSTLHSMSSGRLQKKSMPVRPSSSLMLTT